MTKRKSDASQKTDSASSRINEPADWRAAVLSHVRSLIKMADPDAIEEVKWQKASSPGVPVWSHDGIICTGETYRNAVKLTFPKGAELKDPSKLFNASLEGKVRRAIDIHEGETIDERAFMALIRQAAKLNTATRPTKSSKGRRPAPARGSR